MRRELGKKHTWKVEKQFGAIRKAVNKELPLDEVKKMVENLATTIKEDAIKLDKAGISASVYDITN
jgi:hypothetical protein